MDGKYIILIVGATSAFYLWKAFKVKRKSNKLHYVTAWKQIGAYFKWGSLLLNLITTGLLLSKVVFFEGKAQEDFDIFLTFFFFVFPTILLVSLALFCHIKYDDKNNISSNNGNTRFIPYAIISIFTPIIVYIYFMLIVVP